MRSGPIPGVAWLISDMVIVTAMSVLVKIQGASYPALQIVFIRALVGLAAITPLVFAKSSDFRRIRQPLRNAARVSCNAAALTLNFVALSALPLALVNAISFTRPLVTMVLAALLLAERVGPTRWTGSTIAFLGVLVLVSPGDLVLGSALWAAFGSVFFGAMATVQTRALHEESTAVMMLFYTLGMVMLTGLPAFFVWEAVRPADWTALLAIGVLAQAGQYCFLQAYRRSEANRLAPFSYLSIVLSIGAGWLFFEEVPGPGMLVGIAIILAALRFILWGERRRVA